MLDNAALGIDPETRASVAATLAEWRDEIKETGFFGNVNVM